MARSTPQQAVRRRAWSQAARPGSRAASPAPAGARGPGRADPRIRPRAVTPAGAAASQPGPGPAGPNGRGGDRDGCDPADAPHSRMPAQGDPAGQDAAGPGPPAARGRFRAARSRESRGRRNSRRSPGPGRWGALQGGLGVCIIVASAALGTVATMVTRSAPGFLLGLFVVAGTVIAALAVRPRAGRMIFPVPVLSYLVGALVSGIIYNRSTHVQDGAGHRRGAVDRQRLLRDGARHRAGHRDHHRPLVPLAPPPGGPLHPDWPVPPYQDRPAGGVQG